MRTLQVYVREYCDLCGKMLAELKSLESHYGFGLQIVDIEDDEKLEAKYAALIPVAEFNGFPLFYYHVNRRALDAAFGTIG